MKFTTTGEVLFAVWAALVFGAILFLDPLMLVFALVLASLIVADEAWVLVVTRAPTRWFSISQLDENGQSVSSNKTLLPGETAHNFFYFVKKVGGGTNLWSNLSFLKLSPNHLTGRDTVTRVDAEFRTPFAGDYASKSVELGVTGPLGLLSANCLLPTEMSYSVLPHLVDVAITSAKLLGKGGIGEFPTDRPGIGTEFYDTREYEPGDDYRQVNWKATARRGELIVNEHAREVGVAYYLVLEAVSPDYFDKDRLAASFLGFANALTSLGVRFGIVVHDGESVKRLKRLDEPSASLAFALKASLEFADLNEVVPENELTVTSSMALRPLRHILASRSLVLLSQFEDLAISERRANVQNREPFETLLGLIRENQEEPPAVLYVSGLFGQVEPIIELASRVKQIYGANLVVADPAAPWVVAADETSACDAYLRHLRNLRALRNATIEYQVGEPRRLVQRLLSE